MSWTSLLAWHGTLAPAAPCWPSSSLPRSQAVRTAPHVCGTFVRLRKAEESAAACLSREASLAGTLEPNEQIDSDIAMQQLACGGPPLQPPAGTSGGPSGRAQFTLAAPLLAPGQRRISDRSLAGRSPRPATLARGGSGGGSAPNKVLTAEPHQQHAQPPRPGAQQQQQQAEAGTSQQRLPLPPAQHRRQLRVRAAADQPDPSGAGAPSSSASPGGGAPPPAAVAAGEGSTQLIFRLERRGDGWGEEILPHLVVEQRPLEKKKKRAYSRPDPWKVRRGMPGAPHRPMEQLRRPRSCQAVSPAWRSICVRHRPNGPRHLLSAGGQPGVLLSGSRGAARGCGPRGDAGGRLVCV